MDKELERTNHNTMIQVIMNKQQFNEQYKHFNDEGVFRIEAQSEE